MSEKQTLMSDLLSFFLIWIRNTNPATLEDWQGLRAEADLLHNLPECMTAPGFEQRDYHWLDIDVVSYLNQGRSVPGLSDFMLLRLGELRKLATSVEDG